MGEMQHASQYCPLVVSIPKQNFHKSQDHLSTIRALFSFTENPTQSSTWLHYNIFSWRCVCSFLLLPLVILYIQEQGISLCNKQQGNNREARKALN